MLQAGCWTTSTPLFFVALVLAFNQQTTSPATRRICSSLPQRRISHLEPSVLELPFKVRSLVDCRRSSLLRLPTRGFLGRSYLGDSSLPSKLTKFDSQLKPLVADHNPLEMLSPPTPIIWLSKDLLNGSLTRHAQFGNDYRMNPYMDQNLKQLDKLKLTLLCHVNLCCILQPNNILVHPRVQTLRLIECRITTSYWSLILLPPPVCHGMLPNVDRFQSTTHTSPRRLLLVRILSHPPEL